MRPALTLASEVSFVKAVGPDEGVSYGHHHRTAIPTVVATVPIGYADGYPRRLSQAGSVLIGGEAHPLAGTVTMDQIVVDVGDADIGVGDEVVLLGRQDGAEITADDWAQALGTISHEVVCGIGPRVPRRYVE